jgi:hypothetical protein
MRTVARAIPTAIITSFTNRYTTPKERKKKLTINT